MAKKAVKKRGRKPGRKPARKAAATTAKTAAKPVTGSVSAWIDQLRQQQASREEQMERERVEKLNQAIAQKEDELRNAGEKRDEAQAKVDKLEEDLAALRAESGAKTVTAGRKPGRKPGRRPGRPAGRKSAKKAGRKRATSSGRKPRVSTERKQEEVAKELSKRSSGIAFSDLRDKLLKKTDATIGGPIFAPTDFASSKVFGKKLLPSGWKIKGARKNAEVVPA